MGITGPPRKVIAWPDGYEPHPYEEPPNPFGGGGGPYMRGV